MSALFDEKFSSITRNLFLTLGANGRLSDSLKIIDGFSGAFHLLTAVFVNCLIIFLTFLNLNSLTELMQAGRGVIDVTIISAEEVKVTQKFLFRVMILTLSLFVSTVEEEAA